MKLNMTGTATMTLLGFSLLAGAEQTNRVEKADKTVEATEVSKNPVVMIKTSVGEITAELWPDKAPLTVKNFLQYAEDKFFDGLVFHRVIRGFMIQGGGFDQQMRQKQPRQPIPNEARVDTPNVRGTLSMARTMVVDSATSQFFINLVDNKALDHRDKSMRGFGYCVFGKVIDGMDVVDKIATVKTGIRNGHRDVPVTPVVIESVRMKQQEELPQKKSEKAPEQAPPKPVE